MKRNHGKHIEKVQPGQNFGNWLVVDLVFNEKAGRTDALCKCGCGKTEKLVQINDLISKVSTGCRKCRHLRLNIPQHKRTDGRSYQVAKVYGQYRHGAIYRNLDFDLTREDVERLMFAPCHYCGHPGRIISGMKKKWWEMFPHNGIDRKNSSLGYKKNNVVTCCVICNRGKNALSYKEFKQYIKDIRENTYGSI